MVGSSIIKELKKGSLHKENKNFFKDFKGKLRALTNFYDEAFKMVNRFQQLTVFAKELHYKSSKFASDLNKFISNLIIRILLKILK